MEWRHQPSGHATSKCRLLSLSVGNSNGAISGLSLWTMYAAILLLLLAHSSTLASGQPTEYIETHPQTTRHYCNYSNPDRTNLACHCPRPKCGCYYGKLPVLLQFNFSKLNPDTCVVFSRRKILSGTSCVISFHAL